MGSTQVDWGEEGLRLTHHGHIVESGHAFRRFQHSSMAAKGRIKVREQKRERDDAAPISSGAEKK